MQGGCRKGFAASGFLQWRNIVLLDAHQMHGSKVMSKRFSFAGDVRDKAVTMAHVCSSQLKKELDVCNTSRVKTHDLPYFHGFL